MVLILPFVELPGGELILPSFAGQVRGRLTATRASLLG
jgi:hypothetical protein